MERLCLSLDLLQASQRPAWDTSEGPVVKKAKGSRLSAKVQQLSAEVGQMKELLALQPGACVLGCPAVRVPAEEDALSIVASATLFGASHVPSQALGSLSRASTWSSSQGSEDASMGAVIKGALARLQLDVPQEGPAPVSAFFKRQQTLSTFVVPPSEDYIRKLH